MSIRRLSRMIPTEIPAELRELTFIDSQTIAGIIVVVVATSLVGLEVLSLNRSIPLLKKLDKAGLASRVRNLLRAAALLTWISTVIGIPASAVVFTVMLLAHVSAAIVQRLIDTMHQSRPAQPIANLKIKKRYDKVWMRLPEIKRRRARILYGFDVWLTLGVLALLAINKIPAIDKQGIPNTLLIVGFSTAVAGLIALLTVRARWRQQSYVKAKVADKVEAKLVAELKKHKPQVLLYFTGARSDRYQLEQWLKPVDKLNLKTMVVVREPSNGKAFPACKWPVVVAPTVAKLEKVTDIPSLKVVIYGSNAAKNMHMLRNDKLKHVYLNHGDSDKLSSANPYSRIYDVLLVAGPAGKKRYLDIGFDGDKPAIVEVGRPQLDGLAASGKTTSKKKSRPTILYAPTWEGVANSVNYTSLSMLGVGLAKAAAAAKTHKLVVKLHPNSGRYDQAMNTATEQIKAIGAQSEWVELVDKSKDLYKLFTSSDVLVSDVSAVVSDFLCTNRPLVMTLPAGMTKKNYLEQFPIGKAASIVADDDGKKAFATAVAVVKNDPQAKARLKKKAEVHGTHPKGSQHAFNAVLARVVAGKPAIAPIKISEAAKKLAKKSATKVLISLNGMQAGGAERDCLELSKALTDVGYEVTVFAQHGDLCNELDKRVAYLERPSDRRRAAQILRENVHKFDIVNTHDLRSLAILSKVRNRPPVLAIVHNINARRHDHAARWLLRNVPDEVIFVSKSERRRIFKRQKPVGSVIRPSIGYTTGFVKKLKNVKPDIDTILFCGRLSRERGPDLAIKALPKLPDKTLVIVGDGPMKDKLTKLAGSLGVSSRVKMVGAVSDPYPYIASAGVVLVPSRRDALPRIVREAAALRRPIVAADSSGVREAAAEYQNIRYCDPTNTDEFVAGIYHSLSARGQEKDKPIGTSSWQPILDKFKELETRRDDQTEGKQKQVAQKVFGTSAKVLSDRYQQQKQRYLDRVDQVVADKADQPFEPVAEVDRWKQQGHYAGQKETEGPDSRVVDINEEQASPERRPDDRWLDEKVGSLIQPAAEVTSLVAPSGEFSVSAISQQVDLGRDSSADSGHDVETADQCDSYEPGGRHQSGHQVLMNGRVSNSPGERARNTSTVEPPSPMLAAGGLGQSPLAELGEADRLVDVVALHGHNPSLDGYLDAEIGGGDPGFGPRNVDADLAKLADSDRPQNKKHHDEPFEEPDRSIRKSNDGVFATYVGAPMAEYLVRSHLEPRKISPNQVTVASTVCSVFGSRLITSRKLSVKLVGAGTLGFGFVLDCADGQLARLTETERDSGMVFDELSDRVGELLLVRQLSRASNSKKLGDAATVLLLIRHILSRLPQTKVIPLEELSDAVDEAIDPLRPHGAFSAPLGEVAMTATHLTIGERLAITTAASVVSSRLGASTHAGLGLLGLSRDLAARQIRSTQVSGSAELVSAASLVAGMFVSRKYPGRMQIIAAGPYILLALRRLELQNTWIPVGFQAAEKNRDGR